MPEMLDKYTALWYRKGEVLCIFIPKLLEQKGGGEAIGSHRFSSFFHRSKKHSRQQSAFQAPEKGGIRKRNFSEDFTFALSLDNIIFKKAFGIRGR